MSEECVIEVLPFRLKDRTWETFVVQNKGKNGIPDDDVPTVLLVSSVQLVAFHPEILPLIRFCMSRDCILKCPCSDVIRSILRDLIISKMREEGVPETAAIFFAEWALEEIIITSWALSL